MLCEVVASGGRRCCSADDGDAGVLAACAPRDSGRAAPGVAAAGVAAAGGAVDCGCGAASSACARPAWSSVMATSIAMPIRRNDEHRTTIYFSPDPTGAATLPVGKGLHLRHGAAARCETILMFPVIGSHRDGQLPDRAVLPSSISTKPERIEAALDHVALAADDQCQASRACRTLQHSSHSI